MTSSPAAAEQEALPVHPQLDGADRAALREALLAEIRKARPYPVAERTLTLIAQASLEPQPEPPGYRVVDRHGAPRRHGAEEGGEGRAFTLADLLAELRAKHPGLFLPPEPVPAAVPAAEARDTSLAAGASEMRAATARFLGTQSERARSLAEQSSVQGRALAQSAAGAFATVRGRFRRDPVATTDQPLPPADESFAQERPGGFLAGLRGRAVDAAEPEARKSRLWLVAATGATAVVVLAAVLVSSPDAPQTTAPDADATARTNPGTAPATPAPADPPQASRAPAAPDNVTPPPEGDGRGDSDSDLPPPAPNAVTGTVQVIDTATLKLNGKLVHLFGVEWVRGGQAEELTRYIAGRPVTCQPAPGSQNFNCAIDGRDLSEVILYNGGGRASPEASPELVAAEDHARSERLGVWRR
jgi:hypothetical protein